MTSHIPLFIDIKNRKILVFGGGGVGERKARLFREGDVTVISPSFTPGLEELARESAIRLDRRSVSAEEIPALIDSAFLVVAATGDKALNESIVSACKNGSVLVNSATGESPVTVPSVIKRGDVTIGISTGGKSPAMSRYLRMKIEGSIGEEHAAMVRLQEDLRASLKSTVPDQKERERLIWEILEDPDVWEALKVSKESAKAAAMKHVP